MGHKARAINAPPDNGGKIAPIKITNEEFLKALAGEDWPRVPISWGENSWWVSPAGKNIGKPTQETSNYFTVSIFALAADGKFRRTKELFVRQFVFVIDDVGTKLAEGVIRATLPPPTYILETSRGNFQWGYKLTNGTDARALDALVCAIVDDPEINPSLKDPGMKGVTRVARLPVGSNNKDKWKDAEGNGWPHRMKVWAPEIAYSVEHLAFWLGVDLSEDALAKFKGAGGSRKATNAELEADPILWLFDMKGMLVDPTPNDNGFVSIVCPWADEHSDSRNEAGYLPGSGGFKCHHGHCESRNMNDLREWIAQECADEFSAAQAETLRDIFEASPIDWDVVARIATESGDHDDGSEPEAEDRGTAGAWSDGDADWRPPPMLIDKILPAKGLTFLGGQSGAGKSFLAIDIAVALATGQKFFGLETEERVGVLYVAGEGAATVPSRFKVAKIARETEEQIPFTVIRDVPDLSSKVERRRLMKVLRAHAKRIRDRFSVRVGLVVVDTIAACFSMRDENSAAEMNGVCKAAAELGDSLDAATLVLAHYGKSQESGIRGSSATRGAGESVIAALGERDELKGTCTNRRLVHLKSRTGEEGATFHFDLEHVPLGFDDKGRPFGAAKLVRTGQPAAAGSQKDALRRAFVQTYERLAEGVEETTDPDGVFVRKVAVDVVREELRRAGFLERDAKGSITAAERKRLSRVREQLLVEKTFVQEEDLIWLCV